MTTPSLTLVSTGTNQPAFVRDPSDDGRFISYVLAGNTLVVKDMLTGAVQTVASFPDVVVPSGETLKSTIIGGDLSADGRFVVFGRDNGTLVNGGYPPEELFVKDLVTGTVTPIASGGAPQQGDTAELSSDGRFVAYAFPGDSATGTDIRLHDRVSGSDKLVIHLASPNGGDERVLGVSTDGNSVFFVTANPLLGETDGDPDVFVKDLQTGALLKITDGGYAFDNCMTPDGRAVVYTDLDPTGILSQVYLHDFDNPFAADRLISASTDGAPGNGASTVWSISADGNFVAFSSSASNLVANDTDDVADLFVKDLLTGEVTLVAVDAGHITSAELSANGSQITFTTSADLLLSDTDGSLDVYLADIPTLTIAAVGGDDIINASEALSGASVTGTSNAIGGTVTVSIDGKVEGTATVAADGSWTLKTGSLDLANGAHTVTANVAAAHGGTDSDSHSFTVDRTPPVLDIATIAGDFVVNVAEARAPVLVTGTSDAIGSTVEVFADTALAGTAVVQADGTWSVQVSAAGLEGNEVFSARVTDQAGNTTVDVDIAFVDKSHAPADLSAAGLDGTNGFKINGITGAGAQHIGLAIGSAGDINGDGIDDIIIGNDRATPNVGENYAGQSYVVFGRDGGFPAALNLANLDGANGFRIDGLDKNDSLGRSVAAAGDFNGDGIDDFVIGAPAGSSGGLQFAGETYVVFGKTDPWGQSLDLGALGGKNGFRIDGTGGASGGSVASAGDVNGDGFDDVILGAANASPGGKLYAGESYVVFGAADGFAPTMALTSLDGSNGFKIPGTSVFGFAGNTVASAGDVNGDGFGDLLVTATLGGKGEAYLLFGQADWKATPSSDLAALNGANGFRIDTVLPTPAGHGIEVAASAGDINADGFDDLILGGDGKTYVVFGKDTPWDAALVLSELDDTDGFRIVAEHDRGLGQAASAGDVNGDGIDDLIIAGGFGGEGAARGEVHVIYGKAGGWAPTLSTASLDGGNGFTVAAANLNDGFGSALASGDVNKDGFADLVIGAFSGKGGSTNFQPAGEAYVVFGADLAGLDKTVTLNPVTGDDRLEAGELKAAVAVSGTSDAIGDTIDLILDGAAAGSAIVAADGTWSTTIDASALTPGHHHLRATATDDGGYTASDGAILTVPGPVDVKVIDGYISGASVFADGNGNGKLDAGESAAVSDGGGHVAIALGDGAGLVAIGGTDIATGLTQPGTWFAPADSSVITPLTTLEHYLIENENQSKEDALQRMKEALNEAADAQGKGFGDPINGFLGGNVGAGAEIIGNAQIAGACAIAGAALAALDGSGGVSADMAYDAYAATMAHILATNPDATLRQHSIRDALDETLRQLQLEAHRRDDALDATATLIGALFGDTGAIITQTNGLIGTAYLSSVAAISLVAQGGAASDLSEAVGLAISGPPNFPFAALTLAADAPADPLAAVVAAYTGEALLEKIAAAQQQLGDVDGPEFENAPVALADSFVTDEDRPLVVDGKDGVLANDSDADGDTLTATLVSGPAHGVIILGADGSFAYTPDADFNGSDSFTYKAGDGGLESAAQTVTITVNPVNDAIDAQNDSYATDEDRPLVVDTKDGVLANDSAGAPLSAILVDGPDHGKLTLFAGGAFLYTPDANYNGADSFSYRANDGKVDSNLATVSLTVNAVNDDPTAPAANSVTTDEDKASAPVAIGAADVEGDSLAYSVKAGSGPALGTVDFQGDSFVYTPNANANGADSFVIVVDDGHGGTTEQAVAVTVNAVNDVPEAQNDSYATDEDRPLVVEAEDGVLANDSDDDPLSAVLVDGPDHGKVTLFAGGAFLYTPDANYNGADSFSYKANDGTIDSNLATVSLTVNAVNDDPTAPADKSVTTDEDKASAPVAIGAADLDGDALFYSLKAGSGPALGTVGFQGGSFVYTPNANANGADSFVIVIEDGQGGTIEQAIAVTINAVADAAVIGGVTAGSVTEDGVLTASGQLKISDPDAGEASFQAGSFKAAHGTLTLDAAGAWAYTLDNNDASVQALNASQTLPDSVTVHAADGTAQQILISIHGADESTGAIVGDNKANNLNGTPGNDVIEGRGGSDTVHAGAGNDSIVATVGDGIDFYFGGSGYDTLDLSAITAGVTVNLIGIAVGGQTGVDLLSSIENAIGGKGNDLLIGDDGANLLSGGGGNDSLFGDSGNDTLLGGPGKDSFSGGRGDDIIALAGTTFSSIDGGSGTDTLRLDGAGLTLDLTAINQTAIKGIEHIDLTGSGNNTLTLSIADVLDLSNTSNQLVVMGDAGDTVHKGAGWTAGAVVTVAGQDYQAYTAGAATLLVDTDIATVA